MHKVERITLQIQGLKGTTCAAEIEKSLEKNERGIRCFYKFSIGKINCRI